MLCPHCQVDLVMSERQGIEIDYCPKCRGVWLDRGELDKIIERGAEMPPPRERMSDDRREYGDRAQDSSGSGLGAIAGKVLKEVAGRSSYGDKRYHDDDDYKRQQYGYKKKKSWLNEIFD